MSAKPMSEGDPGAAAGEEQLRESLEFQRRLNLIIKKMHDAESFAELVPVIEPEMLSLLNAERITVYQRGRNEREIVSKYKSGTDIKEIRVPLATSSISGYVALSQQSVRIQDAYDAKELEKIHANLKFSQSFDKKSGFRTRSVMAVPIKYQDVLLGVLQVLNKANYAVFTEDDLRNAEELANVLGQKFRYELRGTRGPYDYLVHTRKLKQEQLDELKKRTEKEGTRISDILVSECGITRQELGASLEQYYQVPFMAYDANLRIPRELITGINESYMLKQLWVPVAGDRNEVTILIDDPSDAGRIMEIQRAVPAQQYVFKVGLPDDIRRFLGQGTAAANEPAADIHELVGKLQDEAVEQVVEVEESGVDENAATVIQLVNRIITEAYDFRASDIHVEPGKGKKTSVRYRIDGVCRAALSIPASHAQAVISRIKIISGLDISERRKPQDGKAHIKYRGQPIELRVATLPTVNGESAVLRILASSEPLPLAKLNFIPRNLERIERLVEHPHGIFLVVGPTGSGKTTTLHSILGHINTPERKIWTAEDPVEISQPGLHQVQVQPKVGLTFATALRAFLRADPDVIMIGEMRDHETAHAGVEASLTGHLVFSTLHTNSAPETVVRLLDLGLDPVSFADALLGVLAQRLVRTLCADCKKKAALSGEDYTTLARYYGESMISELSVEPGKTEIFQAVGCAKCGNSGYKGRTGIHELLVASSEMKSLICHRAKVPQIRDLSIQEGMRTLMQDGIQKLFLGQTDLAQIRKVAAG